MLRPALIIAALALGIATVAGWAYEVPYVDGTVDAEVLLTRAALYGSLFGVAVGLIFARQADTAIGRFQAVGSSVVLCTALVALLAHVSNRTLGAAGAPEEVRLAVKQVTAYRAGRGITREAMAGPPDGYYVVVETGDGPIRLERPGGQQPEVGPDRSITVERRAGYWGFPRYGIPPAPADE